jgi:hypothetical protein
MPLSAPQARTHLHTRSVEYRGYHREDGLWDIEATLQDVKTYTFERHDRSPMPAGEPIHGMSIRVTVDDSLTILAIESSSDHAPFAECQGGKDPMQKMVGATMGPGWRVSIERALGNTRGCTHLREMLFNMATAAFQTVPPYQDRLRKQAEGPNAARVPRTEPPFFMNKCVAWDFNGTLVARSYPQFVNWQAKPVAKTE